MIKAHPLVGQLLQGTYRIERLLGQGGMGEIFEASHLRLTRRFAIKMLSSSARAPKEAFARLQREAQIASAIGHPHILEIIDFNFLSESEPYIVMELLEGEDLAQRLYRVGRLDLASTNAIFQQAASAMQAAHERGVVHRDLKPQNIFLCPLQGRDDFVKIVDFGVCKIQGLASGLTEANTLLGTPNYMSPEQAEEKASTVDHRTDIYAMGAILFEMLAGRPPFAAQTIPALLYQIVQRPAPLLGELRPDLPGGVGAVIARALSKQPSDRFASMAELAQAFEEAATAQPCSAQETPPPLLGLPTIEDIGATTLSDVGQATLPGLAASETPPEARTPLTTPKASEGETMRAVAPRSLRLPLLVLLVVACAGGAFGALVVGLRSPRRADKAAAPIRPTQVVAALPADSEGSPADATSADATPAKAAPAKATPAAASRLLWINSRPRGAEVLLNNTVWLGRTPLKAVPVPTSRGAITINYSGYETFSRLLPEGEAPLHLRTARLLPRAVTRAGACSVGISALRQGQPVAAEIFLDGKKLGAAPLYRRGIVAGAHMIEARLPGGRHAAVRRTLRAGQENNVVLKLDGP